MNHELARLENDSIFEVEEDDWSEIIQGKGDVLSSNGFARHDSVQEFCLPLPASSLCKETATFVTLRIASMSALSPIDMINLSSGTIDATGHRIWTGAKIFLHAIPYLSPYLDGKHVLEMGSGTGIAGIAVAKMLLIARIVLTDGSDSALDLCRRNCEENHVTEQIAYVKPLQWGDTIQDCVDPKDNHEESALAIKGDTNNYETFDAVIASDVIYDLAMWKPILQTAFRSHGKRGYLIVSNVPRAALSAQEIQKNHSIEDILLIQAASFGFLLINTITPKDLPLLSFDERRDAQEIGSAIFVWQTVMEVSS